MSKPKWKIVNDKEEGVDLVRVYVGGTYIPNITDLKLIRVRPAMVEIDLKLLIGAHDIMLDGENILLTELVSFVATVDKNRETERLDGNELKEFVKAIPESVREGLSNEQKERK